MPKENLTLNPTEIFKLDRINALADGIFAIVVTLLVLGIDIPENHNFSEQGLLVFLQRIGYHVLFYAISFWLAATYWIQHAAIMHYFRVGNRTLIWLNLLFLFPVTLLPFITELRGVYRHEALTTVIFGAVQIFIGLALQLLWKYAVSHPHLLYCAVEEAVRRKVAWRMLISPILLSVIAVAVSFLSIHLSALLFLSIPLYYLSHRDMDRNWRNPE